MAQTVVLRKSHGPFSAGTRVALLNDPSDDIVQVEAIYTKVSYHTDFQGKRIKTPKETTMLFAVPVDDLVKLRNKTDTVPNTPRISRVDRVAKRKLYALKQQGAI